MLEIYWPETQGEWLEWTSAVITIAFGLIYLFAPRIAFRLTRLATHPDHPEALAEGRARLSGFYLGVGLCAILFSQPLVWLALGVSWAFTAFGRLISMLSDRGNTLYNWIALIVEILLAALPLIVEFGFIV